MKRVLITRPSAQSGPFGEALQAAGWEPVFFPVIQIGPLDDYTELDQALCDLAHYDWLVLTSVNGVEAVWSRFAALGIKDLPQGLQVAAIGPKTAAALHQRGVQPDYVPDEYVAEAILPGLGDLRGKSVLLPRADIARKALPEAIEKAGGRAVEIAAYLTLPAQPDSQGLQALRSGVQVVTFTSSSTVRNFVALVRSAGLDPDHLPGNPLFACIGPITAATALEEGLNVGLVAGEYTTEGLVEALSKIITLDE